MEDNLVSWKGGEFGKAIEGIFTINLHYSDDF